jgi:acetyl-CoA carboxylase biotin carboxyl carrier protein
LWEVVGMSGLTRSDINEILGFIENSNFTELRIETGDLKIELRRAGAPGSPVVPKVEQEASAGPALAATAIPAAPTRTAVTESIDRGKAIPAPMLGIFYHAPKPGDEPFVKPGDVVSPETVIGIIEVMKLMNRVSAGISGIVTEIVAPSGELVEHGDPLIRVKVA